MLRLLGRQYALLGRSGFMPILRRRLSPLNLKQSRSLSLLPFSRATSASVVPKKRRGILSRVLIALLKTSAVIIAVPVGYGLIILLYDSTTYEDGPLGANVDIPLRALTLPRGGPKNLPIADAFVDDNELNQNNMKPRLVILGTGWAAVAVLRGIDKGAYNVTVISPTNHFLVTPLLPSAAVGTMQLTSLVEPIRAICRGKNARFLEGAAHDIDFEDRLVEVRADDEDGGEQYFYVPYDKVIIAAGAKSNTHGVSGLEHCYFFKNAVDVLKLRQAINRSFEIAALPTTTAEERQRLLSFVICGGGPTGVELASEIFDLLREDLGRNYPSMLLNHASVHIIQSRSAILNTYDSSISKYAMEKFMKNGIALHTNARVKAVTEDNVVFSEETSAGQKVEYELPYGVCIWTTGIALTRLTKKLMERLKSCQHNRHALETDSQLRLLGAPLNEVYAIGDCATVRTDLPGELANMLCKTVERQQLDSSHLKVGELIRLLHEMAKQEPQAGQHINLLNDKLRRRYDRDENLTFSQVVEMLKAVDKKVVSLPPTAQRANQQGRYMAEKLNAFAKGSYGANTKDAALVAEIHKPFNYHHFGSLAYIPNEALFDAQGLGWLNGLIAMYLWRSVYWTDGPSPRSRAFMLFDWISRGFFGRDMFLLDRSSK